MDFVSPAYVDDLLKVYVRVPDIGRTSMSAQMELARDQTDRFLAPVYVGDTIAVTLEFVECDPARAWVRMEGAAVNQDGVEVMRAGVSRYLPAELRTP